ncbi:MAG: antibiotic biosynthesis monooxygenase family protein [Pseudomonadota bacterium]
MLTVIFEVTPKPGQANRYFEIAAALAAELQKIDGFMSVERFESVSRPGRFLSLSTWRDEAAVRAWRNQALHRSGQREGRDTVFESYRIRVAQVLRDYSLDERRDQAPADSNAALL